MTFPAPVDEFDDPLVLPDARTAPPPRPFPLLASLVPIAGALVLWLVTGMLMTLLFAALGPLIAVAGMLDARRTRRRELRRARETDRAERIRIEADVARRHAEEHRRRWSALPDLVTLLAAPADIWRRTRADELVVARGTGRSAVRVRGGEGIEGAADLRRAAATLRDVPVAAPVTSRIAVVGPDAVAAAVVRALVARLCLASPPDAVSIVGTCDEEWFDLLPHRASHGAVTFEVGGVQVGPGIVVVAPGRTVPSECDVVLRLTGVASAVLHRDGTSEDVGVELLGRAQAREIASALRQRAARSAADAAAESVALADVLDATPGASGLTAPIGRAGRDVVTVDLVADGPHAVVAGVTGAGKSELLITWVTALCAARPPAEVVVLLADFKGGAAFDPLAALPHVVGVLTDLDGAGAERAIDSLRAEVRRRETEFAAVGARDIDETALPRLVVVVDEFAALLTAHPDLHAVFLDLAARGRALGIHLILGTQRVAGVVRDAVLANCPLRVSLRVTDAADSRAVLGSDDAAALPGGVPGRGLAYIRRAGDATPQRVRVALTSPDDITAVVARVGTDAVVRAPWVPPLPERVALADLPRPVAVAAGAVVIGLADEPTAQRQRPAVLPAEWRSLAIIGGGGSGRTTALDTVQAQVGRERAIRLPDDPESTWDVLRDLDRDGARGMVLLVDDIDLRIARYPAEHAQVVLQRCERLIREARADGLRVVVALQRATGAAARLADACAHRLVLRMPSRADHVAATGASTGFDEAAVPGRGILDGVVVQVAIASASADAVADDPAPRWTPSTGTTAVVVRTGQARRRIEAVARAAGATVLAVDDAGAASSESLRTSATVVVGDADGWQRRWQLLAEIRGSGDVLVDGTAAQDLRALTGHRDVPAYCSPGLDRAWLIRESRDPVRIAVVDTTTRRGRRVASERDAHRAGGAVAPGLRERER